MRKKIAIWISLLGILAGTLLLYRYLLEQKHFNEGYTLFAYQIEVAKEDLENSTISIVDGENFICQFKCSELWDCETLNFDLDYKLGFCKSPEDYLLLNKKDSILQTLSILQENPDITWQKNHLEVSGNEVNFYTSTEFKEVNLLSFAKMLEYQSVIDVNPFTSFDEEWNEKLEQDYRKILEIENWEIDWDCGYTLDWDTTCKWVSYDEEVNVNPDLENVIRKLENQCNTVGLTHKVKTEDGVIEVTGGTYGWTLNSDEELTWLEQQWEAKESAHRTPVFSHVAYSKVYGKKDVGANFVLVDKGTQIVYLYEDGKVTDQAPCVTGTKGVHDTPAGVYFAMEIKPEGKWLTGDDYRTWVNRWIRLTDSGVGLHDASWRNLFGSSIYTFNGSHGCINLPFSFADRLCEVVTYGFPVVVKED